MMKIINCIAIIYSLTLSSNAFAQIPGVVDDLVDMCAIVGTPVFDGSADEVAKLNEAWEKLCGTPKNQDSHIDKITSTTNNIN